MVNVRRYLSSKLRKIILTLKLIFEIFLWSQKVFLQFEIIINMINVLVSSARFIMFI